MNILKNYFFCLVAFSILSFVSCSNDDDASCSTKTDPISIEVEGVSMSNITGTASVSSDEISIDIDGDSANNASVFFDCPNTEGTYDLNFSEGPTVTAFVPAEVLNIILTTGCIEVVSVDDSEVVMRFNVNEDGTGINDEITLDVL